MWHLGVPFGTLSSDKAVTFTGRLNIWEKNTQFPADVPAVFNPLNTYFWVPSNPIVQFISPSYHRPMIPMMLVNIHIYIYIQRINIYIYIYIYHYISPWYPRDLWLASLKTAQFSHGWTATRGPTSVDELGWEVNWGLRWTKIGIGKYLPWSAHNICSPYGCVYSQFGCYQYWESLQARIGLLITQGVFAGMGKVLMFQELMGERIWTGYDIEWMTHLGFHPVCNSAQIVPMFLSSQRLLLRKGTKAKAII